MVEKNNYICVFPEVLPRSTKRFEFNDLRIRVGDGRVGRLGIARHLRCGTLAMVNGFCCRWMQFNIRRVFESLATDSAVCTHRHRRDGGSLSLARVPIRGGAVPKNVCVPLPICIC